MDIRQLKSFVHIAELGSFSSAAERLNISQPALSRQIRLLEEELGERLLKRTGRGAVLTEAGKMFQARAQTVISEIEDARRAIASFKEEVRGHISFGLPPSVGVMLTGPLVEAFRKSHPAVTLRIVEDLSGTIQEALLAGRLDLGILYEGTTSPMLETQKLLFEQLYLVGPKGAGLSLETPIRFRDAIKGDLILPGTRHGLRAILEGFAFRHGESLSTVIEADSLRAQLDLVQRGLGRTFLPHGAIADHLTAGLLEAAPVIDPILHRTTVLAWPKANPPSRAAKAFVDLLKKNGNRQFRGDVIIRR